MNKAPVNECRDGESMREFHQRIIGQYAPDKINPAVDLLKKTVIQPSDVELIQKAIADDPDSWIAPYHFFFGMAIRNALRNGGFGEDYWPIWNLDDIYVPLLELAVAR